MVHEMEVHAMKQSKAKWGIDEMKDGASTWKGEKWFPGWEAGDSSKSFHSNHHFSTYHVKQTVIYVTNKLLQVWSVVVFD